MFTPDATSRRIAAEFRSYSSAVLSYPPAELDLFYAKLGESRVVFDAESSPGDFISVCTTIDFVKSIAHG